MLTLVKKEKSMSEVQNNKEESKTDWVALGTTILACWAISDTLGKRQALEDARADRFLDSIDRISRWF